MGTAPHRLIGGFMLATALLSMWISNSATAIMMLPVAVSVLALLNRNEGADEVSQRNLGIVLMLAGCLRRQHRRAGNAHRHAAECAARRLHGARARGDDRVRTVEGARPAVGRDHARRRVADPDLAPSGG